MNHLLTIAGAVAAHARLTPSKLGVRDSRRSLTFAQWHERSHRLAAGLRGLGLVKGDRVALLAYNCIEWMEIYVALADAGLVAVPLNFRLMSPEIGYIAKHCEARAFIVQDELVDRVEPLRAELDAAEGGYIAFGEGVPENWARYETLIADAPSNLLPVEVFPGDMSALMYTSGTTGRPKGAIRSHEGSTLIAMATALEMGFTREDTALMVMPMCHANSLYFSHTFAHLGATCVIDDRKSFDPEALLATLASERVTFTSLVPTHYIMMLGLPETVKSKYDVSAVEKLMISSAPARRETKLAIMEYFRNGKLHELYGSTEAGWVTLLRPEQQFERLGSVGREWAGSGPIRLLDAEGREVPDGDVGELFSRTPYVFDGYWKNPEKTAEAFRGEWCSVGDMARRDAHGFIHLVDRKSNMIISGGENVYPSEVEAVIGAHPGVKDVAVLGIPHDKWGEAVHAVVVLHEGADATESELIEWCRSRMAGYKRPQSIHFMDDADMPRTATGKILHRVLRDQMSLKSASA
ncbi:class I adenylate-forming enzyme family protein [Cupriavidus pinatubonensis]|uniref:Long-chain-fatty-acid--CoA ligase n=1 Tax=Cupriavidus pinatubonensis TaxID=248026 RepID=A0ABN7ZAQ6_9BURK|nr:AMP-binding protein [Cupriavidus pinatubonensis]CAG9181122.1 Long-chain-fatty-acid--CoA ligase [Cupriavidus pinatubonensis]